MCACEVGRSPWLHIKQAIIAAALQYVINVIEGKQAVS